METFKQKTNKKYPIYSTMRHAVSDFINNATLVVSFETLKEADDYLTNLILSCPRDKNGAMYDYFLGKAIKKQCKQ